MNPDARKAWYTNDNQEAEAVTLDLRACVGNIMCELLCVCVCGREH